MKSLALTEDEQYDTALPFPMPEKPEYAYGTQICLDKAAMEKLGLDPKSINGGDTLVMHSLVKVTNIHCDENEKGEETCRLELQITDAEFDGVGDKAKKPERSRPRLAYGT